MHRVQSGWRDEQRERHAHGHGHSLALEHALGSIERILAAEKASTGRILYAENWVYAPSVQKEREILQKTGAQILWMHAEESHSGSHAKTYAYWKFSGGMGSIRVI